ncbi:hypothetical protein G7Y89_g13332 [Cudoniella acicularis]|uniref:Uncharacterized protein n=1 Tax=Cudoniella acicularis TaxID=354080 RepID=A0A8H4VYT6_9HELO|nr:hypothetical protein G7Y89_g13332 [Cudoniella acicularis]
MPLQACDNIFIENGLISFVTFYYKGYSVSGSTKIIYRYLPEVIKTNQTTYQTLRKAIDEIIEALDLKDKEEAKLALKYTIRRLYLALICYTVGSVPFKSPVLSFYTILSRKKMITTLRQTVSHIALAKNSIETDLKLEDVVRMREQLKETDPGGERQIINVVELWIRQAEEQSAIICSKGDPEDSRLRPALDDERAHKTQQRLQ